MVLGDAPPNNPPNIGFYSRNWKFGSLRTNVVLVAPYFTDLYVGKLLNPDTAVTFKEIMADNGNVEMTKALDMINSDIHQRNPNFQADYAFVVTFKDVLTFDDYNNFRFDKTKSFQIIIATDGTVTYGIFNYAKVHGRNVKVGFHENGNCRQITSLDETVTASELDEISNIGVKGRFVILLSNVYCDGK